MAKILNIFDIGPFIHAGACNTHAFIDAGVMKGVDGYREIRVPAGGVAQILNHIKNRGNDGVCVFCADRNPTIKKDWLPSYKSRREHKEHILKQKELAEYILNDIGYDVLFEEGYEADDIIYSLVTRYKDEYDHIYVYTADSDLYFLVSDNVSIRATSSRAKDVNMENYERIVNSKQPTPYNVLTVQKIAYGDKSDEIPPLSGAALEAVEELLCLPGLWKTYGDRDKFLALAKATNEELYHQAEIVFPLPTNVPQTLYDHADMSRLNLWGGLCRAKMFRTIPEPPKYLEPQMEEIIANKWYED